MKHYARSFSVASRFLPEKKRWATYAVYSFCRYADNLVDNPRDRAVEQLLGELNNLKEELDIACVTGESEHPALKPFVLSCRLYDIPVKYAYDLIEGVTMDLNQFRYKNFDELYLFCYRVAAVVGLMMTYILGFRDKEVPYYAEKMGIAMQLTNILRDIKEDKDMGRIYLPLDEMEQFGISERDIIEENFSAEMEKFMRFQVERAHEYYEEALPGIRGLDKSARFAIYAAARIYRGILRKIEERGFNPFLGRVYVPNSRKLRILIHEFVKVRAGMNDKE
ncbi:MAG: phytoene/squalene synthase family protein [Candidatus Kapaibacterium sp.]